MPLNKTMGLHIEIVSALNKTMGLHIEKTPTIIQTMLSEFLVHIFVIERYHLFIKQTDMFCFESKPVVVLL